MKNRKPLQLRQTANAAWSTLALSTGGRQPPGRGGRPASAVPPRKPTLTEEFNAAAQKPVLHDASKVPVYKQQIELLRRQMSQPKHTLEMTVLGSVTKSINPEKNRSLNKEIEYVQGRLSRHEGLQKKFSKAARQGLAKTQFNQASKGMGM